MLDNQHWQYSLLVYMYEYEYAYDIVWKLVFTPAPSVDSDMFAITCTCTCGEHLISRYCAEFISMALHSWEGHVLERSSGLLEDVLRRGVVDADSATRKHIRRLVNGDKSACVNDIHPMFIVNRS